MKALKDYKISIEYKHLKQHAPGGVYLIPSFDVPMRLFFGVIFLRRGLYTNGIFKFRVILPEDYNDVDTFPRVFFDAPIFPYNPMVDEKTGELNIKISYPNWDPQKHYLITLLTHLKKIFYVKSFDKDYNFEQCGNMEALQLFNSNKKEYIARVMKCVKESQARIYANQSSRSTVVFKEDALQYQILREMMEIKIKQQTSSNSSSLQHLSRSGIFDMVSDSMQGWNSTEGLDS